MKLTAAIYTSNTGTSKAYAEMFAQNVGIPVYSLAESIGKVEKGSDIIYFGWLMAGTVKGYKKAAKLYKINAVCGVGMAKSGSQDEDVRKTNKIITPVFTLQGGYCKDKLRGIYKFMMGAVEKGAVKGLTDKPDKTDEEKDMLDLMIKGGSRVSAENLKPVIDWYNSVR